MHIKQDIYDVVRFFFPILDQKSQNIYIRRYFPTVCECEYEKFPLQIRKGETPPPPHPQPTLYIFLLNKKEKYKECTKQHR